MNLVISLQEQKQESGEFSKLGDAMTEREALLQPYAYKYR